MYCWHDDHRVVWQGFTTRCTTSAAYAVEASDLMMALLQECDDVFTAPMGLPPCRERDHHIHLLSGTTPIVVHSYHYPRRVKDELERQCSKMLQ
jgi:hypothetical protein